jgi:hypothetical protein
MKSLFKSVGCALSVLLVAGTVSTAVANPEQNPNYQPISIRYNMDQEHKLALHYDVYAGGFKALNAVLTMDLDKKAYDMSLQAETEGFIGSLFPWKATYNTSGHAEQNALIPSIHTSRSIWRNTVKVTELQYGPDGKVLKMTVMWMTNFPSMPWTCSAARW